MYLKHTKTTQNVKLEICIYSQIILKCLYWADVKNGGNGARIYFLAKHWDKHGRGRIDEQDFRSYCLNDLAISDWNYRRWFNSAVALGLISVHQAGKRSDKKGDKLELTGYRRVFNKLKISTIKPMTKIALKDLLGKNWKSEIFACFIATLGDNPISRETIERWSGVKPNTQLNLEKRTTKIIVQKNYAKDITLSPGHLIGIKEHQKEGAFLSGNQIMWQMPNSYKTIGINKRQGKSTLKKVRAYVNGLSEKSGGHAIHRLYCETDEQLKKAGEKRESGYLYLKSKPKRKGFWEAVPCYSTLGHVLGGY